MKKLDLHIHTVPTISDAQFSFSKNALIEYVEKRNIDAIAITNHNMFDLDQYNDIKESLPNTVVFPGIEINVGINNAGHLLIISKQENVKSFSEKCKKVEAQIKTKEDYITMNQLHDFFGCLKEYLLIPHYDKKPKLDKKILENLEEHIKCGEVNSVKKFMYCQKDETSLTPVYFSDFRLKEGNKDFPIRQTYFDIDEITIETIKICLNDKQKVSLTESEGHQKFFALPEVELSTGLNVVIGERSSGKTHLLNSISTFFENAKYIKQFELLEKDSEKAAKTFTDKIATKQKSIAKDFFEPFSKVVAEVKDISLEQDERQVEKYLESLKKHAAEAERADMFSKCKLYAENEFEISDLENLKNLISAVEKLIETTQYRKIVEEHIKRDALIALYKDLIFMYIKEKEIILKKEWANNAISNIKMTLQSKTAATPVEDVNFYAVQMNRTKVKKFRQIAESLKKHRVIYTKELEGFCIEVTAESYSGASGLKSHSQKRTSFSEAYNCYDNPYAFLQKLKEKEDLEETTYHEYFAEIKYKILNEFGFEVSGGERAEFNLLQAINDAYQCDILMIDEPESSFDNIFLRDRVNHLLKEISKELPVIIVTHNSTVGASIKPDFLVHTKRYIKNNKEVQYEIYCGHPTSKQLRNNRGETIDNINVTLDCLEAGEEAYKKRGEEYEMLRNS